MDRYELIKSYISNVTLHKRMWQMEWNRLNPTDLSYSEYNVLAYLNNEGPKQAKDLVQNLQITSGGITAICNKLIEKGLLTRKREDQRDRRAVSLAITDAGRVTADKLESITKKGQMELFSNLSIAEIAIINEIYKKLVFRQTSD